MAQRGRPKKNINAPTIPVATLACPICKRILPESEFYNSNSLFFNGKITYCKKCVDEIYRNLVKKYQDDNRDFPEKDAMRRICMAFDIYWRSDLFETAQKTIESKKEMTLVSAYFKIYQLVQYSSKTYDKTIDDEGTLIVKPEVTENSIPENTIRFFGSGFTTEDYLFLQEQYDDWTARHECNTKVQEEIFKQLCFNQLETLKATRAKQDTKDLIATFQKLLDSAKLQPKQNTKETISDSQVFGTLIDKWETTRPIPEPEEELRDVDGLGRYIDVFYRGHLAKMMGLKNGLSNIYTNFMKKYTVDKPEYDDDNSSEALFDAIFGIHDVD